MVGVPLTKETLRPQTPLDDRVSFQSYTMGGSNTFNKALNDLEIKRKKPPNVDYGTWLGTQVPLETQIYVDMSVLLYMVHATSNLGFESFFAPVNVDDGLIQHYLNQLQRYLDPIFSFENVLLVFEAGGSRHNRKRSTILNNGIRNVFLKNFHGSTALGKKAISRSCGLPALELQRKIAGALQRKYNLGFFFAEGKADQLIFQMDNAAKTTCFVYSVDQDYLVYSEHVTGLIGPKLSNQFIVKRSEILEKLEITSNQLIWCFCAAGSDDVVGIPKVGFKKAFNACKNIHSIASACNNLKSVSNQAKRDLLGRIASYFSTLAKEPIVLDQFPETTTVPGHQFIMETKEDGSRRRLQRLGLDPDSPYGIGLAPWVAFGKNPNEGAKYPRPFQRIDDSKASHARTFSFRLEPPAVSDSEESNEQQPEQQIQKQKRKSKKRKSEQALDAPTIKKRKRNQEKQVLDRLSALHMKCVRTVGSLKSLVSECIAIEFVPWFQNELVNIKVVNF